MIEVILLERVERLGLMGEVVKVRPGFARNFLLPQKKALRATKSNLDLFEKRRGELEASNAADRAKAMEHAEKIDGLNLVLIRQASEAGQLYGSVSARDVSDAAIEAGQKISRTQVQIDQPIKTLGLFPVKVRLHPEVSVKVTINVARSAEEAAVQTEKGATSARASAEKAEVVAAFGAPAGEEGEAKEEKKPARKAKAKSEDSAKEEKPAAEPKAKKSRAKKSA